MKTSRPDSNLTVIEELKAVHLAILREVEKVIAGQHDVINRRFLRQAVLLRSFLWKRRSS